MRVKFDLGLTVLLGVGGYFVLNADGALDDLTDRIEGKVLKQAQYSEQERGAINDLVSHADRFSAYHNPTYVSLKGLEIVALFEGFSHTPYKDAAGVLTIGYGHTRTAGKLTYVTKVEAMHLLREDMASAERAVNAALTVSVNQNEYDALVSLAYNIGNGGFSRSTLLARLNSGDRDLAARHFADWRYADGKENEGLLRRRREERELFETPTSA